MTLRWSVYGLTMIRSWPYSGQIMALQWPDYGLTVIRLRAYSNWIRILQRSDHDLTVVRLRAYSYQTMTLKTGFWVVPEVQPFPLPSPQTESGTHPVFYPAPSSTKCPVRKADYSPPHSADVKNVWSYMSTSPYIYLVLYVIKYMNILVFIRIRYVIKVCKWEINMFGNLVMVIAGFCEMSVYFYHTTRRHEQEVNYLHCYGELPNYMHSKTQLNLACSRS
jgi:hypothetical protein